MSPIRQVSIRTARGLRTVARAGQLETVMDEPRASGGSGTAPTPIQTLLASLGGCTAITLKLYSARKDWPLEDVQVQVQLLRPERGEGQAAPRILQTVTLQGPLDAAQRERLLQIAGRCPVHRLLAGPLVFEEREG